MTPEQFVPKAMHYPDFCGGCLWIASEECGECTQYRKGLKPSNYWNKSE